MTNAKIVSSTSHIAYIARVYDDAADPGQGPEFGVFVRMECSGSDHIGVVCDSRLVNPEYVHNSPMAGSNATLGNLSEKLASEQKTLIGILILGWIEPDGKIVQGVPGRMLQANQSVEILDAEKIEAFHRPGGSGLEIKYLSSLLANAGSLGGPLAELIIDRLWHRADEEDRRRLGVLKDSLGWKRSVADVRI